MTEPQQPEPEAPRPPGTPDLDLDVPVGGDGDDRPGNEPADEDVQRDAGTMEPPD
ncbi:hypothetical protein ACU61A_07655 [Pseudonocardia sichuanensis]|uniref:Uncharacterized protein n=1 Tax=Pseudonocardia kunmingensis TaxID=630975 RepID=A0A543D3I0_9PSEU|nr:hypothetical protein [Pseudonocardia kunmingensis]TQM03896.1 hypothetical protein FB558_6921 [Pseudonocardia kunmingensis]